jgi:hypothetical protein
MPFTILLTQQLRGGMTYPSFSLIMPPCTNTSKSLSHFDTSNVYFTFSLLTVLGFKNEQASECLPNQLRKLQRHRLQVSPHSESSTPTFPSPMWSLL